FGPAQPPKEVDPLAPGPSVEKRDATFKTTQNLSAAKRIDNELDKPTDVDFIETPLKDVVDFLKDKHAIPIVLKTKKLEEASVSADTPVTKQLHGISLRSVLNLILEDLELTYVVKDEVLQITSPYNAQAAT